MSLLLSKVASPKLVHILQAIYIALCKQKTETANLLLNFLFSDEFHINPGSHLGPEDRQSLLFKSIFHNAIQLDSHKLTNFVLRCTPKIALQLMNSDALFFETIVQGSTHAAKAF